MAGLMSCYGDDCRDDSLNAGKSGNHWAPEQDCMVDINLRQAKLHNEILGVLSHM